MPWWLHFALQAAPDIARFDLAQTTRPSPLVTTARCASDRKDEVVVCGRANDRYRLPLPRERDTPPDRSGDLPGGMAALTSPGACGIFAGERRCSKREAARYGYGKGRDPVTVLARAARKVVDPDAD